MSSVLARPGTPTIRLLPPTNSVSSTWPTTSSWPMISFLSSVTICWRPLFIRSASATSSCCRSSTLVVSTESPPTSFEFRVSSFQLSQVPQPAITPLAEQQCEQQKQNDRHVPEIAFLDRRHAAAGVLHVVGQRGQRVRRV